MVTYGTRRINTTIRKVIVPVLFNTKRQEAKNFKPVLVLAHSDVMVGFHCFSGRAVFFSPTAYKDIIIIITENNSLGAAGRQAGPDIGI